MNNWCITEGDIEGECDFECLSYVVSIGILWVFGLLLEIYCCSIDISFTSLDGLLIGVILTDGSILWVIY